MFGTKGSKRSSSVDRTTTNGHSNKLNRVDNNNEINSSDVCSDDSILVNNAKKTVLMGDSLFNTRKTESLHELSTNSVRFDVPEDHYSSTDNLTVSSSNLDTVEGYNVRNENTNTKKKSKNKKEKSTKKNGFFRFIKRNANRPSIEKLSCSHEIATGNSDSKIPLVINLSNSDHNYETPHLVS